MNIICTGIDRYGTKEHKNTKHNLAASTASEKWTHLSVELFVLPEEVDTQFCQSNEILEFSCWCYVNFADNII